MLNGKKGSILFNRISTNYIYICSVRVILYLKVVSISYNSMDEHDLRQNTYIFMMRLSNYQIQLLDINSKWWIKLHDLTIFEMAAMFIKIKMKLWWKKNWNESELELIFLLETAICIFLSLNTECILSSFHLKWTT